MGWYDAFKGDTARVNLQNAVTSDSGSAAKNFGDAFAKIGKSMYDADVQDNKDSLINLETQNQQNKLDTAQEAQTQKKFDDAFAKDYQSFDDKKEWDATKDIATTTKDGKIVPLYSPSADAVKKEKQYFKTIANDTGYTNAVTAGVGDKDGMSFEDWRANNPNASAAVVAKVQKLIEDKDNTKASIENATKNLKHENEIVKLNAKLAKSEAKKDNFKKPSSISAQKTASTMVDSLYMKKDENGNLAFKEGVNPQERDFVQKAVSDYLKAPDSNNNFQDALEYADKLWKNTKEQEDKKAQEEKINTNTTTMAEYLKRLE